MRNKTFFRCFSMFFIVSMLYIPAFAFGIDKNSLEGVPTQHVVDFNGDGKTDWVVLRRIGPVPPGQVFWFIQENNTNAPITTFQWGNLEDYWVPEDYDGDNMTDFAVWRPAAPGGATWFILESSTATMRAEVFGQPGDDPTVVGDYNSDGKADVAVYRPGVGNFDESYWFYRTSPAGPFFTRQWGLGGDFPAPGDYDGDGNNDFVVQRNAGNGQGIFYFNYAALAPGVLSRAIYFGDPFDLIVTGDYDGDNKTDIAIVKGIGGSIYWFYEPSTNLGTYTGGPFGRTLTDQVAQGDYDGDGKTDFAVWRPNPDPTQNFFYVRKSSDGNLLANEWGQEGDYPVANFNIH